uniref:Cyst wall protein n=1 Tax=Trepomonas sp. PC1 TaxID=1076344 RepID=A0A146K6D1_9EUKA|eukprot:JAP91069.1 Cyst wall protein [Trepomonas sp. PC1]
MFLLGSLACTTEKDALMDIYNYNGGDQWKNAASWGVSDNHCNWEGVICNGAKFVIELNLAGQGLTGTLSTSIACLPFLKSFNLNNNQLTSVLDPLISTLQGLQYFQASNAGFTGQIPTSICEMQHLMYLYLDHNAFSGAIPECVGNMTFLREVHLDCNQLSGTVPVGFNTLQYLTELRLQCNPELDCTSELSTRTNFVYVCADADCSGCVIAPTSCPLFVDIPNCGRYYPMVVTPLESKNTKKSQKKSK